MLRTSLVSVQMEIWELEALLRHIDTSTKAGKILAAIIKMKLEMMKLAKW